VKLQVAQSHTFAGHALGHATGQAFGLDHIDPERQVAGVELVTQVSALQPAQPGRLDEQQIEVRERARAPCGTRSRMPRTVRA
jgi:hypothetical protein